MAKLTPRSDQPLRTPGGALEHPRAFGAGFLFGVPVGDLGWFQTLLIGFASGFAAFFAATFCAIIGILSYNTVGRHAIDYAISYKRIGLPVGIVVAILALGYLGSLWIKRQLRRA